jgi:hypothetical protein
MGVAALEEKFNNDYSCFQIGEQADVPTRMMICRGRQAP